MTSHPPSLPEAAYRKVVKISRFNGWSIAIIAGLGSLLSLAFGDLLGGGLGLLAVACAVMEIYGNVLLQRKDSHGMTWLVRAELSLLSIVLVYSISRLFSFDGEYVLSNLTPELEAMLKEVGISRGEIVPLVQLFFRAFYGAVIAVATIYQGGLAFFYHRKTALVEEALRPLPTIVRPPS